MPTLRHRARRRVIAAIVLLVAACPALGAAPREVVVPQLSEDARVVAALRTLRPNHAIALGKARIVGEFNDVARRYQLNTSGPRSRNYSVKMVWAPERARALFAGANHAVPHRLNDVWEFDLGALAWVLLYAPDHPRSYKGLGDDPSDVRFVDGVLVTTRGGPAVIAHSWWQIAYDPVERRMLFMNAWVTEQGKAIELVGGDPSHRYRGPPLWSFTPATKRWQPIKSPPPWPNAAFGGMLEYVDELGGAVWHANGSTSRGTWLYAANRWTDLNANAASRDFRMQAPEREQVAYYDPRRRIIVAQRHRDTFHFDLAHARWTKVRSGTDAASAPRAYDAYTPMYYDPASGHGVLIDFKADELWSYDPDKLSWQRLQPVGDPLPRGARRLAYLDPAHNVFVVIDDLTVWAYRYPAVR